jgi:hypothetical protein
MFRPGPGASGRLYVGQYAMEVKAPAGALARRELRQNVVLGGPRHRVDLEREGARAARRESRATQRDPTASSPRTSPPPSGSPG